LTAQQPLNNIVRITIQAMAAAIAGVDGMHVCSYDEAFSIPTEEAVTIAMRTRDILSYESGMRNVTDPMGGSYYVEYLTQKIEQRVYEMLEEIENRGGFLKYWEKNWVRKEVEEGAYQWKESVVKKEKIVVGINKFNTAEKITVPVFHIDPQVEKTAVERLKAFKKTRANEKVKSALDNVKEVASRDGELMPALIEAARVDATLGEMMGVLREVYGWMQYG
jgi:methylmalonyl-CoA mutase N-terminal domain/subunit